MGAASAVSAGMSAIGGAAKFFEGRKMQRRAQEFIDNFKFEKQINPAESISLATEATNRRLEQVQANSANMIDALQQGGARSVIGGAGRVQQATNQAALDVLSGLEQQEINRQYAIAQGEAENQRVRQAREEQELAGYGQMLNLGQQMKYAGVSDLLNTSGFIGQMPAMGGTDTPRPKVSTVGGNITPAGIPLLQPTVGQLNPGPSAAGFNMMGRIAGPTTMSTPEITQLLMGAL
jgi:hypothetical protein